MKTDGCWRTSQKLLKNAGLSKTSGYKTGMIITALEDDKYTKLTLTDKAKEGVEYIDAQLEKGNPVLVSLNYTYKYRGFGRINEDSTDHYVIVVGRKRLNGKIIYMYWDVGTQYGGKGDYYFVLENNRLTSTSRSTSQKKKDYIVTQIRRNKNKNGFVKYT